ncbi:MAG: His-Xaa-Ser system protein HxsD [Sphingobacteriales bacterium]|nr:MAG: His-Xaa-Ser system protein HxsD [Sphingobacteriales bacterium]
MIAASCFLYKCFYWYGGNFDVVISHPNTQQYQIELSPKFESPDFNETISKVKRDLIDFKLRNIVTKETQTIRELIVAKAFANYDDEENPSTELADPVGFDPLSI